MPEDRTPKGSWAKFNQAMHAADAVNRSLHDALPYTAGTQSEIPLGERFEGFQRSLCITDFASGRSVVSKEQPGSGNVGPTLQAMPQDQLAKGEWSRNRLVFEAPQWFGFIDPLVDEKELPELFGLTVHGRGRVSGLPEVKSSDLPLPGERGCWKAGLSEPRASARLPAGSQTLAVQRKCPVLTFPLAAVRAVAVGPHRSQETVIRFRAPALKTPILLFSLVGGVGGTSLAAGLTRVLANCGERVMLADAGGHSLLPHYFGGQGSKQGVMRKFVPLPASNNEPVSMLSLDVESFAWNDEEVDRIFVEYAREAAGFDRVVWDMGNAPVEWSSRVLRHGARVIVPLLPTAKCLMQLAATEALLEKSRKTGGSTRWQYVFNQFDELDPSHVSIRGRFRVQLGERLLPFVLRSSPLVDEALLHGRTVVDHAPSCPLVRDMWRLARSVAGLPQAYPEIVPGAWGEG